MGSSIDVDIEQFFDKVNHDKLIQYKNWLIKHYALSSVNSMLVALNQYLVCIGLERWKLRRVKIQRNLYVRTKETVHEKLF